MRALLCLLLLGLTAFGTLHAEERTAGQVAVRAALKKSLAFLEKEGIAWHEEKGCLSCHHTPFLVWTHREASRRGLPVDPVKFAEWIGWCTDNAQPKGGNEVLAELLVYLSRDLVPSGLPQQKLEALPAQIAGFQKPDGSWAAAGQYYMEQWPKPEADAVTTMLMLQALESPWAHADATKAARARGHAWLNSRPAAEPQSVKTLTMRLLFTGKPGNASDSQKATVRKLLALQQPDGGWSWKIGAAGSDPIATGEVLYTLGTVADKDAPTSAAVEKAVAFLLKHQRADGAWYQDHKRVSAKVRPEARPTVDGIYTYWSTAWATLGLLSTLPETGLPTTSAAAR